MSCEDYQMLLAQQVDGRLIDVQATTLDLHLTQCSDCRGFANLVNSTDALTRRAFADHRRAADAVLENTLVALRADRDSVRVSRVGRRNLLLAGAAGFIVASLMFLFADLQRVKHEPSDSFERQTPVVASVARIRDLTGPASCMSNSEAEWQPVDMLKAFACPSGATIRTPLGTLCELETNRGCQIRMNQDTELTFVGDDEVQLRRGQVWCSAPDDASFEIVARDAVDVPPEDSPAVMLDQQSTCVMSCSPGVPVDRSSELKVFSGEGRIRLTTINDSYEIDAGNSVVLHQDELQLERAAGNFGEVFEWMRPLLIRKGHADPELNNYINSQIAKIGAAKLSYFSEAEIRSLGEYSVLPLLRYIQSPQSFSSVSQRRRAATLLSDLSPVWIVPELIGFLNDEDPRIQNAAMAALSRLTGVGGVDAANDRVAASVSFQAWWDDHGSGCPVPASISLLDLSVPENGHSTL